MRLNGGLKNIHHIESAPLSHKPNNAPACRLSAALYAKDMKHHLFEIHVYRLTEEAYSKKQNEYVIKQVGDYDSEKLLFQSVKPEGGEEARRKINEASYWFGEFGGGWRYNEIIGYIRVYKYGSQVRAEYWQNDVKRIVKTRKKKFVTKNRKLVPEISIKNGDIGEAIELCVNECKNKLKNRYLDLGTYDLVLRHVNWKSVLNRV